MLLTAAAWSQTLHAQAARQAMPSGRASSEVTLTDARGQAAGADALEPATIALDYGQPHLRGRSLHTDTLVPYDAPWRTGANEATTLTTGVDLTIGGASVPTGRYFVWTMPTRGGWQLILQRDSGQNAMPYSATNDLARIDLRRRQLPAPVESLTMWLIPSTAAGPPRGEWRILWGDVELSTDWVVR